MAVKRPDKAVPLVIYKGGERIVVGSAYLKGDGSIEGQIAKDVRKELKDLLFGDLVGDISLNPKTPPDLKYHLEKQIMTPTEARTFIGKLPLGDGVTEIEEP